MIKKFAISFFIFILSLDFVCAQSAGKATSLDPKNKPYWWTLELGKKHFREKNYGDALIAFQDARNNRRAMYTRMEQDWITLLSIGEVRRYHGALDLIEKYIAERGQLDASDALQEIYYRVQKDTLNNSANKVLEYFGSFKNYPEADYWIGEVYRMEGELGIAVRQYNAALLNAASLQDSSLSIEIQYKIADVEQLRLNYTAMEGQFESILKQDTLWMQDQNANSNSFLKTEMARTLRQKGINQFLTMYRYKNTISEKAHRMLGLYFYSSGRHNRAKEHLMFAATIQNTIIIDEVIAKDFDFKFTTLDNLLEAISRRKNLHSYMEECEYFKTLYYLAAALHASGDTEAARGIWTFLSNASSSGQWQGRAKKQLREPVIESAVALP